MILVLRTDNPQAEVGLYNNQTQLAYKTWQAHRELSDTIHQSIKDILGSAGKDWTDITGIVFYKGPGSFTGLRIGAAVANALAVSNNIPVSNQNGDNWVVNGVKYLISGQSEPTALPEYGSEPLTTKSVK